jgi:hypothetical protein
MNNILIGINGIIYFLVFILMISNFLKHYNNKRINKLVHSISSFAISSFILSIMFFFWSFLLDYNAKDYLLIFSVVVVFQSIMLFRTIYLFDKNKKLFYLLFLYLFSLFSVIFTSLNFSQVLLSISFLLFMIVLLNFSSRFPVYRKVGFFGIFYASISLFCQLFVLFNKIDILYFSIMSNILLLGFLAVFLREIKENPPILKEKNVCKKESILFSFLKYFVFVITLVNFIFLGTIGVHEIGHLFASRFYDCDYRRIVYEENLPRTEVLCKDIGTTKFMLLGGVAFPLAVALIMILIGGSFIREIAVLAMGFNLLFSYSDLIDFGISENIALVLGVLGVMLVIIGIALLARARIEEFG